MQPRRKCGIDSDTTLVSRLGVLIHLSIKIGNIPKVFPADVPPWITFFAFLKNATSLSQ